MNKINVIYENGDLLTYCMVGYYLDPYVLRHSRLTAISKMILSTLNANIQYCITYYVKILFILITQIRKL